MNRLLDNRLRRLEARPRRDPFAGLSDGELEGLIALISDALDRGSRAVALSVSDAAEARLQRAVSDYFTWAGQPLLGDGSRVIAQ